MVKEPKVDLPDAPQTELPEIRETGKAIELWGLREADFRRAEGESQPAIPSRPERVALPA